jgi:myo-inositol 2-dehydrogenase/D-chiro-inositol 1-dehydrogenase
MLKRSSPVSLGLIGCGWVTADRHLPALRHLPEARVIAVADIKPDQLKLVADRFHIERRYTDFRALLEDPDIEAVGVCTPPRFHSEPALAALEMGKHLFIEKPLALGLDEIDRLMERARQSPSKVMVGFNLRWHRLVRQAREMIQRGEMGRIEVVRSAFTSAMPDEESLPEWRKWRQQGGGVLIDKASHHFDLWRFLLQSDVEEVFATSRSEPFDDVTATVTARLSNDVLVSSVFAEQTGDNHEVEIYGEAGRLHVSCYFFDGLEFFPVSRSPGGLGTRFRKMVQTLTLPPGALRLRRGGEFADSYRGEWRHFLDVIRRDVPMECTLEDGRWALQMTLAAVESASLGRPVKITQAPRKLASSKPQAPTTMDT